MDLGISGRNAIICASSRGLGRACATALAAEGVNVVINGRDTEVLETTADEIRQAHDAEVTTVAADVTTDEGRAALLAACPEPDILVNNNNGPAPRDFATLNQEDWIGALEANMVAPLLLISAVLPAMRKRKYGRIINVTSAMVTTPHPVMGLSSGARAGLTAAVKGLSKDVAIDNVTINNMLPFIFDTDRQLYMADQDVKAHGITFDEARERQVASVAAKRFGRPSEFGATCAFLCGNEAGFITGQNFHLDGGSYPALI